MGKVSADDYWDELFSKRQAGPYSRIEIPDSNDPVLQRAYAHFGSVQGRTLIDLGCGRGATSLHFARSGARVISLDRSAVAIQNLTEFCRENSIANILPVHGDALEVDRLGTADFVFGSMILHHIEPFEEFALKLRTVLNPGGRCFFWENNSSSRLMIWFRDHLVGRLWVPKFGDAEESPLSAQEVELLRRHLHVDVEFPELMYFRMISTYLLKGRLHAAFARLDDFFYRFRSLRRLSYRQYVLCLRDMP